MFPKPQRKKNRKLLDEYHGMPCAACGTKYQTHGHHITSRGAHGDDSEINLIPICLEHHVEIHKKGNRYMALKYSGVSLWFEKLGRLDEILSKIK